MNYKYVYMDSVERKGIIYPTTTNLGVKMMYIVMQIVGLWNIFMLSNQY